MSCDLSGAGLPYISSWNFVVGLNHVMAISENYGLLSDLTINLSDGYRSGVELDPRFQLGSYEKVDTRETLAHVDGIWDISLWGRNLTDELLPGITTYGAVRSVGPYYNTTQRSLSWGISGPYRF